MGALWGRCHGEGVTAGASQTRHHREAVTVGLSQRGCHNGDVSVGVSQGSHRREGVTGKPSVGCHREGVAGGLAFLDVACPPKQEGTCTWGSEPGSPTPVSGTAEESCCR